jgi:hypothetical protein
MALHKLFGPRRQPLQSDAPSASQVLSQPPSLTVPESPTTSASRLASPETSSTGPFDIDKERQPPKSSQCEFPIQWDKITFQRKNMPTIRYRQPHKRTLNTKSKPSAIYKYGAQLTTDGENKFWLCKTCHLSGNHGGALFNSESTDGVMYHLKTAHRVKEFGAKGVPESPFAKARDAASGVVYTGSRRAILNDLPWQRWYSIFSHVRL